MQCNEITSTIGTKNKKKLKQILGADYDLLSFSGSSSDDVTWMPRLNRVNIIFPSPVIDAMFANLSPDEIQKYLLDPFFGLIPHEKNEYQVTLDLARGKLQEVKRRYPRCNYTPFLNQYTRAMAAMNPIKVQSFLKGEMSWPFELLGGIAHEVIISKNSAAYQKYYDNITNKIGI